MITRVLRLLQTPSLRGTDPDSTEILEVQSALIDRKPVFQKVLLTFYNQCFSLEKKWSAANGLRIELGSGIAFVKRIDPNIITSDVREGPGIDRVIDAGSMDLKNDSASMLLGINMFHHLIDPATFFDEAHRVLMPGGCLILIEPWHGPAGSLMYKHLFSSEGFFKDQEEWRQEQAREMSGANQALSYIVFTRDRSKFGQGWPGLEIVHEDVFDNYLSYVFSGGLNFRQLIPLMAYPVLRAFEWLLRPCRRVLGLHHVVVIRKNGPDS